MNTVLATLGTKLTERVAARLTGPGLLYIALCLWAVHTGHSRAFDPTRLKSAIEAWTETSTDLRDLAVQIVILLAAATITGQAAAYISKEAVGRLWVAATAPGWWIRLRQNAWHRRHDHRKSQPPARYRPERLTPIGDRFRLVAERADAQYGLSVPLAWPRLVVLVAADTRDIVTAAYESYRAGGTMTAWGLLVLPWTTWWWPAFPVATFLIVAGYWRSQSSAETLATLIESVIDTHQHQLAMALGVELPAGRLTTAEGPELNNILNKRA